jgi:hypothetical protein
VPRPIYILNDGKYMHCAEDREWGLPSTSLPGNAGTCVLMSFRSTVPLVPPRSTIAVSWTHNASISAAETIFVCSSELRTVMSERKRTKNDKKCQSQLLLTFKKTTAEDVLFYLRQEL